MAVIALKCPSIEVVVVDISTARIAAWNSDQVPIYEPGLDDVVKQVQVQKKLAIAGLCLWNPIKSLLNEFSEGLKYARLVDEKLDLQELPNVRKAADIVWLGIDLYQRWLDVDLAELASEASDPMDSIKAQKIGSGLHGLGVGSFGFDWSTVSGFLGSPFATPAFAIVNILAGFFLYVYIIIPFAYWTNMYEAKRFTSFSSHVFDANGQPYNTSTVLNEKIFEFDRQGFFVFARGFNFATLTATLSHVALFHGRTIAQLWRQNVSTGRTQIGNIHTRLMKENYETVPRWWFYTILASMIALAALACVGIGKQLLLPLWGVLLAITFLGDFKLGHYMKIPPKSMFLCSVGGHSRCVLGLLLLIMPMDMPRGRRRLQRVIWGPVGPLRMFGHLRLYSMLNYFFLIGLLAAMPVWLLARSFPNQTWIKLINMPIIFYSACNMPPVRHIYILSAGLDAGVAFMGILCYLALQEDGINGVKWWGMDVGDHCPLAHCPTAKGIVVDGCPHERYKAKIEASNVRFEIPGKGGFFGSGIEQGWRVQL
ncbi:hypothetical protein ACLOJK_040203 [Asimina triloba]